MRILLIITLLCFSFDSLAQPGISWGPEITVSDGNLYGNSRPRATITNGDVPVVIYGKSNSTENLFISRWNGSSFDTPISIIPSTEKSYIALWTGPDIASKGDTVIAVFKLEPTDSGNVYSVRSVDGGLTFSDTIRVDNHYNGVAWMPSMGIDSIGNPIVTYMVHDANWLDPHYVVANSSDAGLTYNPEMVISTAIAGEACDCCPAEMIVQNQKQVLLFRNNDNNFRDIHGYLSLDEGATFPYQTNIDNLGWMINGCPSTGPDGVFMGDQLLTTYTSGAEGSYSVYLSSSSASTDLIFSSRTRMADPADINDAQNFPRISGENDTIVMAWEEKEFGNKEIFCSVALPGSDPIISLTSNKMKANSSTTGIQTNPEIIYKNGLVHLFYQDLFSQDLIYRRGVISSTLELNELNNTIQVYPNPSTAGEFFLPSNTQVVSLVSAVGTLVHYTLEKNDKTLNLRLNQSFSGIYFLSYTTNDGEQNVTKLIVN